MTLAKAPAPQIVLLHGGIYPVYLADGVDRAFPGRHGLSRGEHPRSRRPRAGRTVRTRTARRLAGLLAWYYEHEGVRPMMIGHSQGGVQAVKVLYELAGRFDELGPGLGSATPTPPSRPNDDRRPAHRRRAPGRRPDVSYVSAVGAGGVDAAPSQPVEHARQAVHDSRHGRGFHRLLDGVRSHCLEGLGVQRTGECQRNGTAESATFCFPVGYNHSDHARSSGARGRKPAARAGSMPYVPGSDADRRRPRNASATRSLGRRCLAQREEALGARGAAPGPRPARARRPS